MPCGSGRLTSQGPKVPTTRVTGQDSIRRMTGLGRKGRGGAVAVAPEVAAAVAAAAAGQTAALEGMIPSALSRGTARFALAVAVDGSENGLVKKRTHRILLMGCWLACMLPTPAVATATCLYERPCALRCSVRLLPCRERMPTGKEQAGYLYRTGRVLLCNIGHCTAGLRYAINCSRKSRLSTASRQVQYHAKYWSTGASQQSQAELHG